MKKAKEISALWSEIKPQIGELVRLCHEVESHYEVTADAYQRGYEAGLNDAWEAARKICLEEDDGGIPASAINDIFNVRNYRYAVKDYSASECIEKIRQYKQEKEEDGLRQNIQTIVDQCGYSLDEIAEVLAKMKENSDG